MKTKPVEMGKSKKPTTAQLPDSSKPGELILIYAGTFSAFRLKEFHGMESLVKFLARNKITRDEFAIVRGSIVTVTSAYLDERSALFTDDSSDELTDRKLDP